MQLINHFAQGREKQDLLLKLLCIQAFSNDCSWSAKLKSTKSREGQTTEPFDVVDFPMENMLTTIV